MNWDLVAALGEIVGAIAVVVSLLYLAAQIKQSNRQSASDTGFALIAELNRLDEYVLSDSGVASILVKLKSDVPLTPEEEVRAEALADRMINNYWASEISYTNGMMDENTYSDVVDDVRRQLTTYPALRNHFREVLLHYRAAKDMGIFAVVFEDP